VAPTADERIRAIAARLGEVLGEPLTGQIRRLSGGASRETFAFSTASHGKLFVQIDRRGALGADPLPQAALLEAAARAGVPVPAVLAHGSADPVLGLSWTVVEAIAGSADPNEILSGGRVPEAPQLIESIASALAAVHRMPADPALAPPVEDQLALLRQMHDRLGEPHPTFELAFRALQADRPHTGPRALVHGDFRIGNLMVGEGGVTGVLDWELAHLGEPVEDLGWLCVRAWRFTRPDRPAAGLGSREELLAAYERHAGIAVDPAALRWWELFGTLRWGVICVMQAFTHLSGSTRSIEHAVIGRRACEVEWDLLELLDGGAEVELGAVNPRAPARPRLHDRPTALELLEAARGALGDDVLPRLDGRAAFELRVTLRALGMVGREIAHADEHAAVHAAALARLGVADEAELAAAIRSGALDGRAAEVSAVLRATVRAKLQVANPGYLQRGKNTPEQGKNPPERGKDTPEQRKNTPAKERP
jgi:aminoglycoside phosphotransferase (APT) family kinase protein